MPKFRDTSLRSTPDSAPDIAAGYEHVEYGSEPIERGPGGETHQLAGAGRPPLTTRQGAVVGDDQNTLTVGPRGPAALEDFHLREKIFHFDHERIPERVVHARGFGAHGYFETYDPLDDLTRADLFQEVGQRTPVFVRFSTVAGSKGSADLARDVRGFAVKFYTDEGNWDLVGNNMPVFFIQDAIKFPDLIHAAKEEPDRGFPQAQTAHDNFWDFASLMPEATHMLLWIMSDRALPRSFRFMEGFGVHTFRLVNAEGRFTYVKFHWKPAQGLQSVLWDEAVKINGADPDFHRRDLWDAIQRGDLPEWDLGVQVFDDDFADRFDFDILDATKLIPEEEVPVRRVGRLVLDRVVDNFFAETEQVAFCTQNVVPGIDFTNDPLLQGRNFSYLDTQLKRLGSPNFTSLPVNAPRCPVAHFQQDGHMAVDMPTSRANYEPNSWDADEGGPREAPDDGVVTVASDESGPLRRLRPESFADHYSQASQFFRSQSPVEQRHIVDAFVFELSKCQRDDIRIRMVAGLRNVDDQLAEAVAAGLGLDDLPEPLPAARPTRTDLEPSSALSILANGPDTLAGRKLGVLISAGASVEAIDSLRRACEKEQVVLELIAPTVAGVELDDGSTTVADQKLGGGPSVLYDLVAVVMAAEGDSLAADPAARDFVTDAYAHGKFIGLSGPVAALLEASGIGTTGDGGFVDLDAEGAEEFLHRARELRYWDRLAVAAR